MIAKKDIKRGTKIQAKSVVMVVTGESETAFLGYILYKGKPAGQISLAFDMFENPHYNSDLAIIGCQKEERPFQT